MKNNPVENFTILFLLVVFNVINVDAQQRSTKYNLQQMLSDKQLDIHNREASALTTDGKAGVMLSARENDGVAWLKGVTFSNGIIEIDIKGKDVLQQSFLGVAFHGKGSSKEVIYFRPFNFQAADSVRQIHAVQYVSLPDHDWENLREKFNGQYEKAVRPAPKANEWFHAKIVVKYPNVSVFVNDNPIPCLQVKMIGTIQNGDLGLWVGNNSDGKFANLTVTNIQ